MLLQIGVDSKRLQVRGSLYRSLAPACLIGLGPIRFLVPLFRHELMLHVVFWLLAEKNQIRELWDRLLVSRLGHG